MLSLTLRWRCWFQPLKCGRFCVSSNYLSERKASDNESRHMASPRCETEYEYSGRQLYRKICHTADIYSSSPQCETSSVSSGYLTERKASDNWSRHKASPRCES